MTRTHHGLEMSGKTPHIFSITIQQWNFGYVAIIKSNIWWKPHRIQLTEAQVAAYKERFADEQSQV